MMMILNIKCMHSADKACDTTLDDENTSQQVMSVLVMVLGNQPEAFTSDLSDDQSRYFVLMYLSLMPVFCFICLCVTIAESR